MTSPISIRTRELYLGEVPTTEELDRQREHLITLLDRWRQGVESGTIVGLLAVAIRPDSSCATYIGLGDTYPRVINLGAVRYLQVEVEKAYGLE